MRAARSRESRAKRARVLHSGNISGEQECDRSQTAITRTISLQWPPLREICSLSPLLSPPTINWPDLPPHPNNKNDNGSLVLARSKLIQKRTYFCFFEISILLLPTVYNPGFIFILGEGREVCLDQYS